MKYHHIVWDFDGTLFDSYPALASAFYQALYEYGIEEDEAAILSNMKQSMGFAHRLYREKYHLHDDFFERYEALRIPAEDWGTRPFPGMVELCRDIVTAGGHNYIFTHRGPTTKYFLEQYDLMPSFSELITSAQGFPRKPNPAGLLHLIKTHGFAPEDAMMVGDRALDLEAGRQAGMAACGFGSAPELTPFATHSVHSAQQLRTLLFG